MKSFKFIIKFLSIWIGLLFLFFLFIVYQDFKENKFFNYLYGYKYSEIKVDPESDTPQQRKYTLKITSKDDYLGTIMFRMYQLKDIQGEVEFKIKEDGQDQWYAQNRYDFSYFNEYGDYFFGFPAISNSKGKNFILEFTFTSPEFSADISFFDFKTSPYVFTKYVFPREILVNNPQRLSQVVLSRIVYVFKNTNYSKTFLSSFTISLLASFALFYQGRKVSSADKGDKIIKNLIIGPTRYARFFVHINIFIFSFAVLMLLSISLVTHNFKLAEKLSVTLWISLLISIAWYILYSTVISKLPSILKFVDHLTSNLFSIFHTLSSKKWVIPIIGFAYILLSASSKTYFLGGDDTRLFYLYPNQYLQNVATKIVSDTAVSDLLGFIPPPAIAGFVTLMVILKNIFPFANLQSGLYAANIFGGLVFFYYFISYLIQPKDKYERSICVITSILYVFSIFNFYVLYNSKLLPIFLISVFPLTCYFSVRAFKEDKFYFLAAVALIWSIFNVAVTLPWFGAALITSTPLFILYIWKHKSRSAIYLFSFGLLMIILNLHWLIFAPYSNIAGNQPGSLRSSISSVEFRKENELGIKTVSQLNNVFFPLLNSYHKRIQEDFNWAYSTIYHSWYLKFLPLGYIFIATVILAGVSIQTTNNRNTLYIVAVINFLLALYFFTVNISPWGISFFVFLTEKIPGFVIFRNMYDKFAYALSFQWSIVLAVSLSILIKSLRTNSHKRYLLFGLFILSLLIAKPFIFGEFETLPFWTTSNSFFNFRALNTDYINLVNFVKSQNTAGRYLTLPLGGGNGLAIQDEYTPNHYYAGVSPLLVLTGKNDLSGLVSFSDKGKDVYEWIRTGQYQKVGQIAQQLDVEFVIINRSISSDLRSSFIFPDGLYTIQNEEFFKSLVGTKIKDFGQRYSLYEISPQFKGEKIYLTEDLKSPPHSSPQLSFTKSASHSYQIKLSNLSRPENLVFLDPYMKGWQLRSKSGQIVSSGEQLLPFGHSNGWLIDPQSLKDKLPSTDYSLNQDGSLQIDLRLYFQPFDYYRPSLILSISGYIFCLLFISRSYIMDKLKYSSKNV